ncbi:MAG: zinc ribbon domain-containing protein [bacterium]|nr:zinc ribbon domain-containing protein [bacterium]
MVCTKCGRELPEGAKICSHCGIDPRKKVKVEQKKAAEDTAADRSGAMFDWVREMFASEEEQLQIEIRGGSIRNLFSGGGFAKEIGVVTDKRVYYRGKSYSCKASRKVDCTIDLQDITYTGFTYVSSPFCIVLSVIFQAAGIFLTLIYAQPAFVLVFLMGILFFLGYFRSKRTLYVISHGGGNIRMNVSFFGLESIREFDKKLHMAKDECLAEFKPLGGGEVH